MNFSVLVFLYCPSETTSLHIRFAAEVFHGLQEQVATTASRSHKLAVRTQRIEAALPPLEKAILAQTSHIHFAYTAGVV